MIERLSQEEGKKQQLGIESGKRERERTGFWGGDCDNDEDDDDVNECLSELRIWQSA